MLYDYNVDGYIELDQHEMSRLEEGKNFLTVIRPATENYLTQLGHPGDVLGATLTNGLRPHFNVKVVSLFFANGKHIIILARLKSAALTPE